MLQSDRSSMNWIQELHVCLHFKLYFLTCVNLIIDIVINCTVKLTRGRSVTSATCVRTRRYRRVIWKVIFSFTPTRNRTNVITAFSHSGRSSYSNGIAISITILLTSLHHHRRKLINAPNA